LVTAARRISTIGVLDPTTWAAGLLANTKRISVFATIHTAFNHPIVVAKQMATVDQIGKGRAGINIVAGWNKPEYDTFGIELPQDHNDRYALAQEWWEVVKKIWTTPGKFDHDGKFFKLQHVEGLPKPFDGILPVLNAGSSAQGRRIRRKECELCLHRRRRTRGWRRGSKDRHKPGEREIQPIHGRLHSRSRLSVSQREKRQKSIFAITPMSMPIGLLSIT